MNFSGGKTRPRGVGEEYLPDRVRREEGNERWTKEVTGGAGERAEEEGDAW